MAKIIIFGNGQLAEIAQFYINRDTDHEITAFTVNAEFIEKETFNGIPVVPFGTITSQFPPDTYQMFMPISYRKVNLLREEKYLQAKSMGYSFISYISSKASYYGTPVGENCFIFENNVIQPFSKIGDNVILWSGNHIGHHSEIQDHCFITSHVVISGSVVVGRNSFIGVNATIRDNIAIGKRNVIGAGSVILHNTDDDQVFSPGQTPVKTINSDQLKRI